MAKALEPYRTQLTSYPFQLHLDTQFNDMDVFGHVNNLAIARFYESARARMQLEMFGGKNLYNPDVPFMTVLAEMNFRFLAECNFPEPVTIGTGLSRIGNSSFLYQQAIFQEGYCLGTSDAAMVLLTHGKAAGIPDEVKIRMQKYLITAAS